MEDNVFLKAIKRMHFGEKKYGKFEPKTDKKDMWDEMEEELLDVINYAYFQILKNRELKKKNTKICNC